ncbi:hypothetical protein BHE74_00007476 [Ensete ventricosum]|nr:hypothetical protein BHE74_00007476 [Ensete ventricosum]
MAEAFLSLTNQVQALAGMVQTIVPYLPSSCIRRHTNRLPWLHPRKRSHQQPRTMGSHPRSKSSNQERRLRKALKAVPHLPPRYKPSCSRPPSGSRPLSPMMAAVTRRSILPHSTPK